jgi:hypothetical protein
MQKYYIFLNIQTLQEDFFNNSIFHFSTHQIRRKNATLHKLLLPLNYQIMNVN